MTDRITEALDAIRGGPSTGGFAAFTAAGVEPDGDIKGDRLRTALINMAYPGPGDTEVRLVQNAELVACLALSQYGSDEAKVLKTWVDLISSRPVAEDQFFRSVGQVANPRKRPGMLQVCLLLAACCARDGIVTDWVLDRAGALVTADHEAGVER